MRRRSWCFLTPFDLPRCHFTCPAGTPGVNKKDFPKKRGVLLVGLFSALGATTAQADDPIAAVDTSVPSKVDFNADVCAGSTDFDPEGASFGPVPDLTRVFGQRLTSYQAGNVAPLYDSFGVNDNDAYPPVCAVRFVEGIGPVSEWMFCTDLYSHTCAGTDAEGNLLGFDGEIIDPMVKVESNKKLNASQEKLVAWLIQNGHPYSGTGYYNWGADSDDPDVLGVTDGIADATSTSFERAALQTLIWCISDAPAPATPSTNDPLRDSAHDRLVTCDDNMDATEQARILAMIPDAPSIALSFANSGATLPLAATATFELSTNLYDQSITLTHSGAAGQLTVVGDNAILVGDVLSVTGTDLITPTTVRLSFTASEVGTVDIAASATPASREHIGWN
jgi:hypothetical protein